eukprot:TRINITY_DN19734_c0_g1_i1.p1 TRINITY_DN19734_c0_g1~~TRINITY_DN19734_c0_g1_i1.p1  ORF type:complete len:195 (-),score=-11.03 TRINITY_DN19734_c0_g1_i1:283-867(-)
MYRNVLAYFAISIYQLLHLELYNSHLTGFEICSVISLDTSNFIVEVLDFTQVLIQKKKNQIKKKKKKKKKTNQKKQIEILVLFIQKIVVKHRIYQKILKEFLIFVMKIANISQQHFLQLFSQIECQLLLWKGIIKNIPLHIIIQTLLPKTLQFNAFKPFLNILDIFSVCNEHMYIFIHIILEMFSNFIQTKCTI